MGRVSLSFLVACVLTVAACEPPPMPTAAIDAATMNALLQRMDRLITALEGGHHPSPESADAHSHAAAAQRMPVAGDTEALLARIDALEAKLAVLQRTAPQGSLAAPGFPGAAPLMRTQGVQQLLDLKGRDEQQSGNEAFRSLFMLGPSQVLDRLGTPSNVGVADGNWYWNYQIQGDRSLSITFSQGVVVAVN